VPKDNPFRGSPVWSLGHRDVTGLAFDGDGGLWATESGQQRFQELNRIERGKNYGWPRTEGKATGKGHVKAFFAWRESESTSPSGLAIVDDVAYVADLRGGKLWTLPLDDGGRSSASMFGGLYGPLRTVAASPSGQLWLATSNRDGTATPSPDDDRILRLSLSG
jgi:glucose/arabinose dehydrogenase